MWRNGVRQGRAGQAFEFGEPVRGGRDHRRFLATDRRGPRQDDQAVKAKLLPGSCLRVLDQGLGPREPALRGTGRLNGPARSPGFLKGGLDNPQPITPDATHFGSNARSGR